MTNIVRPLHLKRQFALLRESVAIDSSLVPAIARHAWLLSVRHHSLGPGARDEARSLIERAEEIDAEHPDVLWAKGAFYSRVSGEPRLARDFLLRAGAAGLEGRRLYVALAEIATRLGEWDEALMYPRLLEDLDPYSGGSQGLHRLLLRTGKYGEAKEAILRYIRFNPDQLGAHFWLALLYLKRDGDRSNANEPIARYIDSGDIELQYRRAVAVAKTKGGIAQVFDYRIADQWALGLRVRPGGAIIADARMHWTTERRPAGGYLELELDRVRVNF